MTLYKIDRTTIFTAGHFIKDIDGYQVDFYSPINYIMS